MFLSVACLTLLQVIFCRGHSVEACTSDSDCHCPDRNSHGRCVNFQEDNKGYFCNCYPVHCNPNPCPNPQVCVSKPLVCRDRCNITCPGQTICVAWYDHHHYYCLEPCDANPCSSKQNCVKTNHSPYYECKGPCNSHPCPSTLACIPRDNTHFDCKDPPNNHTTTRTTHPSTTKVASTTTRTTHPSTTEVASTTTRTTHPSTTEVASTTTKTTHPATTDAATSSTQPTPAHTQSDCSEFDLTFHGCHDNSACTLPHVLEVICPDPKEAKYCPTTCGCCPKVPILG